MSKILDLVAGIIPGMNKGNGGYYLELKEDGENSSESSKPKSSNGAKPAKPAKPAETLAEKGVVQDTPVSNGKTAQKEETKPKSKKVSIKERKKAEKAKKSESASSPKAVSTKPAKSVKPQEPQETNFATKYLMPNSTKARRRPGANMNSFLEMARTVKTSVK